MGWWRCSTLQLALAQLWWTRWMPPVLGLAQQQPKRTASASQAWRQVPRSACQQWPVFSRLVWLQASRQVLLRLAWQPVWQQLVLQRQVWQLVSQQQFLQQSRTWQRVWLQPV